MDNCLQNRYQSFRTISILEAHKLMVREGIDLIPVISREELGKVVGAIISESVTLAYEKAKNLR